MKKTVYYFNAPPHSVFFDASSGTVRAEVNSKCGTLL